MSSLSTRVPSKSKTTACGIRRSMSESREQSPVHAQNLSGHITRIVRAEEGNRAGDVVRLRRTTDLAILDVYLAKGLGIVFRGAIGQFRHAGFHESGDRKS